ncbi:MAG: hypothetical protein AAFX02_00310 [Pseudomonadota bacterium]
MIFKSNLLTGLVSGLILSGIFYAFFVHTTKPRILLADDGVLEISADLAPTFEALLPEMVDFISVRFRDMQSLSREEIDKGVDDLFERVYDAVPTYIDAHYSLRGQYTELTAALVQQFSTESYTLFQKMLLEETGFYDAQDALLDQLSEDSRERLQDAFARIEIKLEADLNLRAQDRSALSQGIVLSVDDARQRLGDTIIVRGAAAAVLGTVAVRLIGRKVVQKAAVRGAGKAGGGALGGAVTGASAGSVCGPWCAFGAGVVGWFAADLVILEADKRFNRGKFEAEITQLIQTEHSALKFQLWSAYNKMYREIETLNTSGLQNRRIRDQIG